MASSIAFRFKRRPVYGLPTFSGLAMFLVVGTSLWFSLSTRAPIEQWISFLMILLILVHLLESNDPFRFLTVTVMPFDPPYAGEIFWVPLHLTNPSELPTEPLHFKFEGDRDWLTIPALLPESSRVFELPFTAQASGRHALPDIRFKMRPASGLFQLWRVMPSNEKLSVLPKALDHGIGNQAPLAEHGDPELSHLEFIHDPRLLSKMDQKIFQKTGKPFLRAHENPDTDAALFLDWDKLKSLPKSYQAEQFSWWLKNAEILSNRTEVTIHVNTPFHHSREKSAQVNLQMNFRRLKQNFSEWLYRES